MYTCTFSWDHISESWCTVYIPDCICLFVCVSLHDAATTSGGANHAMRLFFMCLSTTFLWLKEAIQKSEHLHEISCRPTLAEVLFFKKLPFCWCENHQVVQAWSADLNRTQLLRSLCGRPAAVVYLSIVMAENINRPAAWFVHWFSQRHVRLLSI